MKSPTDWVRKVVCPCGREDDFRVLVADMYAPQLRGDGIAGYVIHLELVCNACGSELAVLDNQTNGWNAVICGEREALPADYVAHVKASLLAAGCLCGSARFGCIVWLSYDSHPDDLPESDEDWDEAFGAFAAWAICSRCGIAQEVASAETA
jgi:hypothetical protein